MEPPIVMGSHGAQQTFRASSGRSMSSAVASETQDYAEIHESFTSYQRNLKDVFKSINSGDLESASESLLSISDWLLSRVEFLGKDEIDFCSIQVLLTVFIPRINI